MRPLAAQLDLTPDRIGLLGVIALAAAFLFLHRSEAPGATAGARPPDPDLTRGIEAGLWQVGGAAGAIAEQAGIVYLGQGSRLVVVDTSDPDRPRAIGRTGPIALNGPIRSLAVEGRLAVALIGPRLYAVDVSRPEAPVAAGSIEVPAGTGQVALAGDRAYLAAGREGLIVVDLARPDRPARSGLLTAPADAVAIRDRRAYAVSRDGDRQVLRVIDLAAGDHRPSSRATVLPVQGFDRHDVVTTDGLVLILSRRTAAPGENSLTLIDVADPARPGVAASFTGPVTAIAATGRTAYLATQGVAGEALRVLDIADPDRPVWAGSVPDLGAAHGLTVAGDRLYVAAGATGLRIVDLAAGPARARLAGAFRESGPIRGIALDGSWAYALTDDPGHGRLAAIDRSGPAVAGESADLGEVADLTVAGSDAYVLAGPAGRRGLHHLSLADPARPDLRRTLPDLGAFDRLTADDRRIYLAGPAGLRLLDRSAPETALGAIATPAEDLAIAGDRLYLAAGEAGLLVIDVADPAKPAQIGAFAGPRPVRRVAAVGAIVAIAQGTNLRLIDAADPAHPTALGTIPLETEPDQIRLAGPYAYLALGPAGLRIVDVSFPASPAIVGAYAGSPVRALAAGGNQAAIGADGGAIGFPFAGLPAPLIVRAADTGGTYRIDGRTKRHFADVGAFVCRGYAWSTARSVEAALLSDLIEGPPLTPPGYCVPDRAPLRGTLRDLTLIMRGGLASPAASPEIAACWGYDLTRTRLVDQDLLDGGTIPRGPALATPPDCLPHGAVIRDGADWYEMAGGLIRWAPDAATVRCRRLPDRTPILARSIAGLEDRIGPPLRPEQGCAPPPDGTVVGADGSGTVYVLDGGLRRVIPGRAIARCLGLEGREVRRLPDDVLDDLPPGPPAACPA